MVNTRNIIYMRERETLQKTRALATFFPATFTENAAVEPRLVKTQLHR